MTINLSHQNNCWRYTFLTWALGIWYVIVLTVVVNFIPCRRYERAIGALWVFRMWFSTLFATFTQIRIKRNVFNVWNLFFWLSRGCCCLLGSSSSWGWSTCCINLHRSVRTCLGYGTFLHLLLNLLLDWCHNHIAVSNKNSVTMLNASLC